jgi:heme exporter protein A
VIKVQGLTYARHAQKIFSKITFDLPPSTLLQIRGPNGIGKSSLLKVLAGLWPAASGTIHGPERLLYMGHQLGIHPALNPVQNLAYLLGLQASNTALAQIQQVLAALGLAPYARSPCVQLSRGQWQRLGIARLALDQSSLWILDEPCTALDEAGILCFKDQLFLHLGRGGSVILASHGFLDIKPFKQNLLILGSDHA